MKYINLTVLTTLMLSAPVFAQSLADLHWIAGYWTSSDENVTIEELWTRPSGTMIVGVHRDVYKNGKTTFEYLRIIERDEKIIYMASPGGRPEVPFTLTKHSHNEAVFENMENDFPQRIIYSREGVLLTARIEDSTGVNGMHWTWKKTPFVSTNSTNHE